MSGPCAEGKSTAPLAVEEAERGRMLMLLSRLVGAYYMEMVVIFTSFILTYINSN